MPKKKSKERTNDTVDKNVKGDLQARLAAVNAKLAKTMDIVPSLQHEEKELTLRPTGVKTLDNALSGGFTEGRVVELFGEEQSGKSLISLLTIAEAQKSGKVCMLVDAEQGYVPDWGAKLGVDNDSLIKLRQNVVEPVFQTIEAYAKEDLVDVVVIDSIANMASNSMTESEMGAAQYSPVALAMSRILPLMLPTLADHNVTLILINQVRDEIGGYQKSLKTPGGRAIRHAASTRIRVFKSGSSKLIRHAEAVTGVEIMCEVKKHRGGANFRTAEFRIDYEKGFDREYDLATAMLGKGMITRAGAFYTVLATGAKHQGFENLLDAMRGDEPYRQRLEEIYNGTYTADTAKSTTDTPESPVQE